MQTDPLLSRQRPIRSLRSLGWMIAILGGSITALGLVAAAWHGAFGFVLFVYTTISFVALSAAMFAIARLHEEMSALRRRLHVGD